MMWLANQHGAINLAQGFPDFDPQEELLAALEHLHADGFINAQPFPPETRIQGHIWLN
jgi:aspartate/methionine/tyrosine aminotransferase